MDSLFTYRDEIEGKVGIGKLPNELQIILDNISKEYYDIIPNKNASTYHTWYEDMPLNIKSKVEQIQKNDFWKKLCDGSEKCQKISAYEMDELYYSNPKNKLNKVNLYGASNYYIHKDCIYNFDGIKFYRIIIGLTDGNDNIITYFNNLHVGHKINKGDYLLFDFDKTYHQVIKLDSNVNTPRILLKIHYIICENCEYSRDSVEFIKQFYLYYEYFTRSVMNFGTEPEGFLNFFVGLFIQFFFTPYIGFILLFMIVIIIIILNVLLKINIVYKNLKKIIKYVCISFAFIYLVIVLFFWLRYKLFGIR
jgi:hypothetical protein